MRVVLDNEMKLSVSEWGFVWITMIVGRAPLSLSRPRVATSSDNA